MFGVVRSYLWLLHIFPPGTSEPTGSLLTRLGKGPSSLAIPLSHPVLLPLTNERRELREEVVLLVYLGSPTFSWQS